MATTTARRSCCSDKGIRPLSPELTFRTVLPVTRSSEVCSVPGLSPQSTVEAYSKSAAGVFDCADNVTDAEVYMTGSGSL